MEELKVGDRVTLRREIAQDSRYGTIVNVFPTYVLVEWEDGDARHLQREHRAGIRKAEAQ